ncbi:MAG: nucleotide exchange factor GrpE [Nitrococcus sp.]|nr:nucleotide exchange factor GrpE [Nitrococcus sp.]
MNEQTKERLIAELRDYLDTLAPAPGAETETAREVDLYTLFSELAGLRNEVRLESRQFKGALDEFRGVFMTLEASGQRLQRELDARRGEQAAASATAERPLLLELIALRDRLEQAHRLAAEHQSSALARLAAKREHLLIEGLAEGLGITLRRLDQTLAAYEVSVVKTIGRPFDPYAMRVTAVRTEPAQPDGVVLEEALRGYLRAGEVLRLAEVIANKREPES